MKLWEELDKLRKKTETTREEYEKQYKELQEKLTDEVVINNERMVIRVESVYQPPQIEFYKPRAKREGSEFWQRYYMDMAINCTDWEKLKKTVDRIMSKDTIK